MHKYVNTVKLVLQYCCKLHSKVLRGALKHIKNDGQEVEDIVHEQNIDKAEDLTVEDAVKTMKDGTR